MKKKNTVAERRNYRVKNVSGAKKIASEYLVGIDLKKVIKFGLPEIDDRYHYWRIPLKNQNKVIGEVVIDAKTSLIVSKKTSGKSILETKLLGREKKSKVKKKNELPEISTLRNTIGLGDSEQLLKETPKSSVNLVFTSPPYYNARPEYTEYLSYEEYLLKMRKIIRQCHRVLSEGRFFVLNISPILIRRGSRSESSRRIAVPFDFHQLFIKEGFEFIDDIIWLKPEGAGWATGRGRRFSADRNPLQYKAVPVTEYVLVYRKKTDKLIDWNIRKHPNREAVKKSRIDDGYERTNVWGITPESTKKHPAIFPKKLAEKVIRYYSFIGDVVLDPFAGIGTVGSVATKLKRRFVLFELEKQYIKVITSNMHTWGLDDLEDINWVNCPPPPQIGLDLK